MTTHARSVAFFASALITLSLVAPEILAQRVVLDPDTKPLGATSRTTIVRAGGSLYSLSVKQNGALLLLQSKDSGRTWADTGFTFNDTNSGIGSGVLTNYCCLAVDSRGWLHAAWRRATYPSFYSEYYRNVNPANTSQSSDIIDVQTNLAKVSATTRSVSLGLTIDKSGYVWLLATHSSWRAQLFRSDQPFATGKTPGFTSVGPLSGSGTASQNPFLTVDSSGRIHCMFHYANQTRAVAHNAYDPTTQKWSGVVRLGTPANNNGLMATDRLGNVHAIYGVSGSPNRIEYRKWTATSNWSSPIVVTSFTSAQLGTSNGLWIFTVVAQPVTGTAYAIYRDFARGGALVVSRKRTTETAFTHVAELEPNSTAKNLYFVPNVRGSLEPFPTNGMLCELDVVYQDRSGAKAALVYVGVDLCSTGVFGAGCKGASGVPELSYGELPRLGRPFAIDLDKARPSSAAIVSLGASKTAWGAFKLPLDLTGLGASGCSLLASPDTLFALPTTASGTATLRFSVPNSASLVGLTIYDQFLVLDATANAAGLVTSNGGEFTVAW